MPIDTTTRQLRAHLRAYVDHVLQTGERVVITRHGEAVAALVPIRDMTALEKAEGTCEALLKARELEAYRRLRGVV